MPAIHSNSGGFEPVTFAGSPTVFGSGGSYQWTGKKECGVDTETLDNVCSYHLTQQGPEVDITTQSGLVGGAQPISYSSCMKR